MFRGGLLSEGICSAAVSRVRAYVPAVCDGSSALIKVGQALQPTRAVSMYRYVPYHSCSLFSVLLLLRMEDGGTIHNTYFRLREVNFKLSQLL